MATKQDPPAFYPAAFPGGPWGVDTIGDMWAVIHRETGRSKFIGKLSQPGTRRGAPNYFDRALAEAHRRNRALGVPACEPPPAPPTLAEECKRYRDALNVIVTVFRDHPDAVRGNGKVHFVLMIARNALGA